MGLGRPSFIIGVSNYLVQCNVNIVKELVKKPEGRKMGLKSIFARDVSDISNLSTGTTHGKGEGTGCL